MFSLAGYHIIPRMLQIFRVGKHSKELIPAVLAATAAAYNPKNHEAPLVVGHPSHDAPAHGWVSALKFGERYAGGAI